MPLPVIWNTTITPGAEWPVTIACRDNDEAPMALDTKTLELVIRPSVTDATQPPLVKVTSTGATAQGSVTVDTTASTVAAVVQPAGTALLTGGGPWAYALWMNPGQADATALLTGTLTPTPAPAP